ncbi:hypothetical protein BJ944DRAFT_203963 [Cunninghamella echinulata]|nr:hypothetical protein BJ944DRAFT_203963 [Cunninghamella echinulata]
MELTLEGLQSLLNDLSSIIQIFFFILGTSLIIIPLLFSLTFYHDNMIISSSTTITKTTIFRLYQLSKRITHHINIWLLMGFEEFGIFPLLDRISYWLPTLSFSSSNNSTSNISPSDSINYKLANVCIKPPLTKHDNILMVPGLVNTGNTCYLNSVLQALSSLPRLQIYLDQINQQYAPHRLPVTRSLLKTLRLLSKPIDEHQQNNLLSFRPIEIVSAINTNHKVINREQQDAHELFQLLSGALDTEETNAIVKNHMGNGLKDILNWSHGHPSSSPLLLKDDISKPSLYQYQARQHSNPFVGLLANRLSCTRCGYTEAIRHSSFNNIQLNLPLTSTATLDECLEQVAAMEYLDDASCRKCSIVDLVERLGNESEQLKKSAKQSKNTKLKKEMLTKMVQVEMQRRELDHRLTTGSIEEELPTKEQLHVPYRSIYGKSSKQAMFAKPPKVLCLHISRSAFHPSGVIYKNKCHLQFPEFLDLQQYCTNGTLNTKSDTPISDNSNNNDHIEKQQQQQQQQRQSILNTYKLMSVIVHYGSHNYGHFIAYKRRLTTDGCSCLECKTNPKDCIWQGKETWYRISDENVDICTIDEVLLANPYMLLYESMEPMTTTTDVISLSSPLSTSVTTIHPIKRKSISINNTTASASLSLSSTHFNDHIDLLNSLKQEHNKLVHPNLSTNTNTAITATSTSTTITTTTDQLQADTSVYNSQKLNQHQQRRDSRLVHRSQQRRKMSWETYAVIPTSCN